jgi:hypothetical protein
MGRSLLWLLLGWAPFWLAVWIIARPRRAGVILMGTGLAALVGGMCCAELRRHGVLADLPGAIPVPPLGLRLHEIVRFGLIGLGGALAAEAVLSRLQTGPPLDGAGSGREPGARKGRSE